MLKNKTGAQPKSAQVSDSNPIVDPIVDILLKEPLEEIPEPPAKEPEKNPEPPLSEPPAPEPKKEEQIAELKKQAYANFDYLWENQIVWDPPYGERQKEVMAKLRKINPKPKMPRKTKEEIAAEAAKKAVDGLTVEQLQELLAQRQAS